MKLLGRLLAFAVALVGTYYGFLSSTEPPTHRDTPTETWEGRGAAHANSGPVAAELGLDELAPKPTPPIAGTVVGLSYRSLVRLVKAAELSTCPLFATRFR